MDGSSPGAKRPIGNSQLMAVFERANDNVRYEPFAAVLLQCSGKFPTETERSPVEEAAKRLGLCRLVWLD
jgi:hypothetical protein